MTKDIFAEVIIRNKKRIINCATPTEELNLSNNLDWIEFIVYPNNNKPISIDTIMDYSLSLKWTKTEFIAKDCKCILYEKVGRTFSKQFIKDIKKYFNLSPKDYLNRFPSLLKYRLRFKLNKKNIKWLKVGDKDDKTK